MIGHDGLCKQYDLLGFVHKTGDSPPMRRALSIKEISGIRCDVSNARKPPPTCFYGL